MTELVSLLVSVSTSAALLSCLSWDFQLIFVSFLFVSINSWINYLRSLMNSVANQWISWLLMTLLVFLYKFHFFLMKMQNDLTINYSFFNRNIRLIMILQSTHNSIPSLLLLQNSVSSWCPLITIGLNWISYQVLREVSNDVFGT